MFNRPLTQSNKVQPLIMDYLSQSPHMEAVDKILLHIKQYLKSFSRWIRATLRSAGGIPKLDSISQLQ